MSKLALAAGMAIVAGLCSSAGQAAVGNRVSAQDAHYLQSAIQGDRFEVIGGRIALSQSGSSVVRALGQRLITDHSKSLKETVNLAKQLNVKVPDAPSPSEVWELNTVRSMSGASFDAAYTTLEVKDHEQDIEEATFEAVHGGSPTVKAAAKKELPMLKMHLQLSRQAMAQSS